uniref:SMP-30/Gluconolactonase/LRE-like region domain-containing protein n=1 Tax=Branchiostoma floridae TaxID=7739 RepID=C3Z2F9_BRAFL|eukprot:XP_002597198.1 hypothetical protein BRAFLDRAFT_66324 [Branchiostoma floridae]
MAEYLISEVSVSREVMGQAVSNTGTGNDVWRVDSDGYKGDDEENDHNDDHDTEITSDETDPDQENEQTVDAATKAFVAAYVSKDDMAFIKNLLPRRQRSQSAKTASRGRIDISAVCEGSQDDAKNMSNIHRHSATISPVPKSSRVALDPNPLYNQETPNAQTACNPNLIHPQNTKMHQLNPQNEPALTPVESNSTIQQNTAVYENDHEPPTRSTMTEDDIQPYAVGYQARGGVDGTPYAVAYMCQDDTTSTEPETIPSTGDDSVFEENTSDSRHSPDSIKSAPAQLKMNPLYVHNAPNPIPNAQQETSCACTPGRMLAAVMTVLVLVFLVISGTFIWLYVNTELQENQKVPNVENRLMYPSDVDIDKEGHVWVVGKRGLRGSAVYVVQYGRDGQPVTTIDVKRGAVGFPKIAVDERDNKTIVVEASNEILMFKPDGSFDGSFGKGGEVGMSFVTSDREGNILVTDITNSNVHVYNRSGHSLLTFRTVTKGNGYPRGICTDGKGNIIVAVSAYGRVDMFTIRGEFIRTVVNVTNPRALALGPYGDLVVTNSHGYRNYTVTIVPRKLVLQ